MTNEISLSEHVNKDARKDIIELEQKIDKFQQQEIQEDKFKHFRLTRGIYGQRQPGVQMVRIKIPHGKLTTSQLVRIADVSEKYATGNLHLTTRQDIQLHFVKLVNGPKVWAELEEENITLREACGNTVRNVTGSSIAGIDPKEPFDITPYAEAVTRYFLRNPICQDMGRKFKIAFSSSDDDSAFTYIHDIGFVPRIRVNDGTETRGFKVLIGGGLGAQAIMAQPVFEFLPEDEIIPFAEAVIRVFDRFGERANRSKARMKFLIQKIGLPEFLNRVKSESLALKTRKYEIDTGPVTEIKLPSRGKAGLNIPSDSKKYEDWIKTNVFEQKQRGYFGIFIRVLTGDVSHQAARGLAEIVKKYAADDIRVTINQGLVLRYVRHESLIPMFNELDVLGFATPGFNSTHDVTTCPGTDTCNLGVTNSMELARVLEKTLADEFGDLVYESDIHIKMSGCMNSCGQHMSAQIGFHGSSIKKGDRVAPAMQVVLGGGVDPDGRGYIAEKIVKLPTHRIPAALRIVLNDFSEHRQPEEYFNAYFRRQGKMYFYHLLKPLSELEFTGNDFIDWGHEQIYVQAIGVGECASIILDVVATIIGEAAEKLAVAREELENGLFADSIYNSYNTLVIGAKALLLSRNIQCNTQAGIISDFDEQFVRTGLFTMGESFGDLVFQIDLHEPVLAFAKEYFNKAGDFLNRVCQYRKQELAGNDKADDKPVISNYYKA